MSTLPTSGNPASKKILQNHHRIILPEDDPRNNENFRRLHPNVVFQGQSKKNKRQVKKLNSVDRHHQHTQTILTSHSNTSQGHPAAGQALASVENNDTVSLILGSSSLESDPNDVTEGGEDFLFHEMMQESFDLQQDDRYYGGSIPTANGPTDGVVGQENFAHITPPTNLSIGTITLEPQVNAGDGIATYAASLFFNTIGNDTDYEVRIMKQ